LTETFRLALRAVNLGRAVSGLDDWLGQVETRAREAVSAGARLLLMPEYASEAWLGFKPAGLPPTGEIAWLAGVAEAALPGLQGIAERCGIALLPGTMPWAVAGAFRNRAWLIRPDGRLLAQDKLCLTPFERDPESWTLAPGDRLRLFALDGWRCAVLVCLDVEMPALACLLAPLHLDLVLVPSMTDATSGHARVFGCARARAVELMCAVACSGVVGSAPGSTQNPRNVSGNAVYLPCEPTLGSTGVLLATPVTDGCHGEEPFDVVDLPLGVIRAIRAEGGEVWPGAWSAAGVQIELEGS
jgi:predicted amidohydrolase